MEGIVEAKSVKNKSMKIGENWYDCDKIWKYAKNVTKGDKVNFDAEDVEGARNKSLKFIKVIGKASGAAPGRSAETNDILLRENALRTAVMYIESQRDHAKGPITLTGLWDIADQMENKIRHGFKGDKQ